MGMYTEVFLRAGLRKDAPQEIIDLLNVFIHKAEEMPTELPDHPFFACDRWSMVFGGGSAYFPSLPESNIAYDIFAGAYEIVVHGNLKNYDNEIDLFFDWIDQYLAAPVGEYIGYAMYEEDDEPQPHFKRSEARL